MKLVPFKPKTRDVDEVIDEVKDCDAVVCIGIDESEDGFFNMKLLGSSGASTNAEINWYLDSAKQLLMED